MSGIEEVLPKMCVEFNCFSKRPGEGFWVKRLGKKGGKDQLVRKQ